MKISSNAWYRKLDDDEYDQILIDEDEDEKKLQLIKDQTMTMTEEQATEIAGMFTEMGKCPDVRAVQPAGEFATEGDPWRVELWFSNDRTGNRTLTVIEDYEPKLVKAVMRKAVKELKKGDREILARFARDRAMDQE